jgi:protein MpaA
MSPEGNLNMSYKWTAVFNIGVLLTVLVFAGCGEPVRFPQIVDSPRPPTTNLPPQYRIAGSSVEGRPILYIVLGEGPDVIFILATIHGNEPAGTPLVHRLIRHLEQNREILNGRTIVLLPVANPDGLANGTRHNVNNVDLNRNFIAANRSNKVPGGEEALSEPEAHAIYKIIQQHNPDRIVSIHQPLACIDYDGPGKELANHMAQYCDLPVKKLGARPGSLGSYVGVTKGIPIITFEMLGSDSDLDSESLWRKYGRSLLATITYPE